MSNFYRGPLYLLSEINDEDVIDIQLLKTGKFSDPRYGNFPIDRKMFSQMISNFKKNVLGREVSLDYVHEGASTAAAWMKDLYEKNVSGENSELWAKVELTGSGKTQLSQKNFKYVSAEFDPKYKDNEKGDIHGYVLEGVALTNRPVIRGMKPVQLSEGENMNEQEIKLMEKYKSLMEFMEKENKSIGEVMAMFKPKEENMNEEKELMEAKALSQKLADENKELKLKMELSEKNSAFDKMLLENKAVEAQRDSFLKGDIAKFAELSVKVSFSEKGNNEQTESSKESLEDEIANEAKKMVSSEKISLSEAIKKVSSMPKYKKEHGTKF